MPTYNWLRVTVMVGLICQIPLSLQKCIFDQVQAHVRVVRAAHVITDASPGVTPHRPQTMSSGPTLIQQHWPVFKPIRIRTWVVKESDDLPEAEKGRLAVAVEHAVKMVSSLLSVDRAHGPLLLSRDPNKYCRFLWKNSSSINVNRCGRAKDNYRGETCLHTMIPDDHLAGCDMFPGAESPRRIVLRPQGAGLPDTDFLLYLHIQNTDKCRLEPQVFAYAVHCQVDVSSRPVAGLVVICKDRLSAEKYSHRATVLTLIHELFHTLGFSKDLFSTWTVCSASQGCYRRGKVTHADESGQMRIFTPSVTAALQKHLASSEQELGGPLENQDSGPGGLSSHWESRVLRGSIMAAMLEEPSTVRIDPITLAAFQDMGWYSVNLSREQDLLWGEGEGTSFGSASTCQSNSFFCTQSGPGCHYLHKHKGECRTDAYLEGCRVYKTLNKESECWKKANSKGFVEEMQRYGEIYGPDSMCFFSNLTKQNPSQTVGFSSVKGLCYRHRCTGINRYQIQVSDSEWVDCPAGETVQVKGYEGLVSCPDRRLCVRPDVSLLWDEADTFTSDHSTGLDMNGITHEKSPAMLVMSVMLSVTVVSLLAAVILLHRKCSVRIHPAGLHQVSS